MKFLLTKSKKGDFSSFLLIGFLLLSLVALVVAIKERRFLFGRADEGTFPRRIRITDLSENSFSVSWVTNKPVAGAVQYQLVGQALQVVLSADQTSRQSHHLTVTNLQPASEYLFYLLSGGNTFDNQGEPFRVTTYPLTEEVPIVPFLVYGRVRNIQGQPATQAVVYFSTNQSTSISTMTNEEGNFILALNNSWTLDQKRRFRPKSGLKGELLIEAGVEGQIQKEVVIQPDLDLGELILGTEKIEVAVEEPIAQPVKMSFWERIKRLIFNDPDVEL